MPSSSLGFHSFAPDWIEPSANLDMDFANSRYYDGTGASLASLISVSRASSATNLLPTSASGFAYSTFGSGVLRIDTLGILLEESRVNRLLNSTAPATQTTASLATGTYTLWVNGAGSAAVSAGTATITGAGTATNGSPKVFTVTGAGTVTVTKTGALNAFQLELGGFGTSLIVTAGAAVTRAADIHTLAGNAATAAAKAQSMFFITNKVAGGSSPRMLDLNATQLCYFQSTTQPLCQSGANTATCTVGSGNFASVVKSAFAMDSSSFTSIANNGAKVTQNSAWGVPSGSFVLGNRAAGDRALNGYLQRMAFSLNKSVFDGLTA